MKFFEPPAGALEDAGFVRVALRTIGHEVDELQICGWTAAERLVAYDYSVRVRIHADARAQRCAAGCELRDCPSFVIDADVHHGGASFWRQLRAGETRKQVAS